MPECATVKIQTGPDSYIVVNETDYEDFKFMEYTQKKEYQTPIIEPIQDQVEETTPTKRRKTVEE